MCPGAGETLAKTNTRLSHLCWISEQKSFPQKARSSGWAEALSYPDVGGSSSDPSSAINSLVVNSSHDWYPR